MKQVWMTMAATLLLAGTAHSALAAHHRHHHHGRRAPEEIRLDLSPVTVKPYVLPDVTADPVRASFVRRMNLENGVEVRSTRGLRPADVTTRNLFILDVTQSLEGGFDSVNMYDKGVLSWGIMQWTASTGSLPPVLIYIKRRLLATGQQRLWDKVFVAQGLDADRNGLIAFGKPLDSETAIRLAFRGSQIPGNYDPKIVGYWATVMARAGRQSAIQQYQTEYAAQAVDSVLTSSFSSIPYHAPGRDATVADLTGNDPYAEALIFALWTNNPRHAREYVGDAARAARTVSKSDDPTQWSDGAFSYALLQRCHASRFGNWRQRAAVIEARAYAMRTSAPTNLNPFERGCQTALAARKAHQALLASRHEPVPASTAKR